MIFTECSIEGVWIIDPAPHTDERGFFARVFCAEEFAARGLDVRITQMNDAWNGSSGTLRGLHYQDPPYAEAKLVRVITGSVYDVIVDVRPDSPTRYHWIGTELSARSRRMLYAPPGCAHGYLTLEDDTELLYSVSASYAPRAEQGLRWDDPVLRIDWPAPVRVVSEKDRSWPLLAVST